MIDDDRSEDAAGGRGESRPHQPSAGSARLPEDEPWPGIEDNMSDGENVDPESTDADDDDDDNISSQPSEYPSTQAGAGDVGDRRLGRGRCRRRRRRGGGIGFRIHEDGDMEVGGGGDSVVVIKGRLTDVQC